LAKSKNSNFLKMVQTYNGYEGPEYEVIENPVKNASYEIRLYKKAKWTSTEVATRTLDEGPSLGFRRLFNYITGKNNSGANVSMTSPVTIAVNNRENAFSNMKTVVSFYVPSKNQESPPEPSSEDVYIEERDELTAYVKKFGGYAKSKDWYHQVGELRDELIKDGIKAETLETDMFYAVAYDSPFRFIWRRNEVWILQKKSSELQEQN